MLDFHGWSLVPPAKCLTLVDHAEAAFLTAAARDLRGGGARPEGFFALSPASLVQLQEATQRLHRCFLLAVDHVLADDHHLARFGLHPGLWPLLRHSWRRWRTCGWVGRFDFACTPQGLKLFEYNADSAGCLFEFSRLQGKWAAASGLPGICAGSALLECLERGWRSVSRSDLVHLLHDRSDEERYTAQLMRQVVEAAGQRCKLIEGAAAFSTLEPPTDADGEPIRAVWKTWAWRTIVQGLPTSPTLLPHLLLPGSGPQVVEPFWKILASSKAMLPVLCELFPGEPCLLPSTTHLPLARSWSGFVVKPLHGRGGQGVRLFTPGADSSSLGSPDGSVVYQAYCPLPIQSAFYVQLSSFCVAGRYAGAGIRCSRGPVLTADASCVPLRVLPRITVL